MEDFQSDKDLSIRNFIALLKERFGSSRFEFTDFSDADLFAIDFKKENRLIHISTWDYRNNKLDSMKYYSELEFFNENTLETIRTYKILKGVDDKTLLFEINLFLGEEQ
jgi:hypothetical protein